MCAVSGDRNCTQKKVASVDDSDANWIVLIMIMIIIIDLNCDRCLIDKY